MEDQIRAELLAARDRVEATAIMKSAYLAGWTLGKIGEWDGVSREAVRLRIRNPVPVSMLRDYPPPPALVQRRQKDIRKRLSQSRILGLRTSSPIMRIPVVKLNRIAELHSLVTTVRGWTPLDSPARAAMPEYKELLLEMFVSYGVPEGKLGLIFGLSNRAFEAWLRNHGELGGSFPSQRAYAGVVIDPHARKPGAPRLVVGGQCRRGHLLADGDLQTVRRPAVLHVAGGVGSLCGVKNPSHVTNGTRYADCAACITAAGVVGQEGESRG